MYAIKSNGVGQLVSARRIKPEWDLADDEAFTVSEEDFLSFSNPVMGDRGTLVEGSEPVKEPTLIDQIVEAIGKTELEAAKQRLMKMDALK